MSDPSACAFSLAGEGHYRLIIPHLGIEFDVDRLRRERGELHAELSVACGILGSRAIDGVLSIGSFNLSSPRVRQERARQLAERARSNGKVDWLGFLEELCQRVLAAERRGQPAVILRTLPPRTADPMLEVAGWRLPREHPAILFGDGGAAKSYVALWLASELEARGIRTALLDWELTAHDHRERLARLCGPQMPDVRHVRCDRPLVYELDRLRRIVDEHAIAYVVVDSAAYACDGPPEAAESAMAFFRGIRALHTGALILAHVTRSEQGDQRPFGSVFWSNSARATWHIRRSEDTSDPERITVAVTPRKANLAALPQTLGFELQFTADRTHVRRIDVGSVDDLAAQLPIWQRMRAAVRHEPLTLAALAAELNAKVDTIDRYVRRYPRVFTRVDGPDGVSRIAILD